MVNLLSSPLLTKMVYILKLNINCFIHTKSCILGLGHNTKAHLSWNALAIFSHILITFENSIRNVRILLDKLEREITESERAGEWERGRKREGGGERENHKVL